MKKPRPVVTILFCLTLLFLSLGTPKVEAFTCSDVLEFAARGQTILSRKAGTLKIGIVSFPDALGTELRAKDLELILASNPRIEEVNPEKFPEPHLKLETGLLGFFGLGPQNVKPRIFRNAQTGNLYLAIQVQSTSPETGTTTETSQLFLAQKTHLNIGHRPLPGAPAGPKPGSSDRNFHGRGLNDF
jgi:hypothetical protein